MTAAGEVWPSPQIDASCMTRARSSSSARSGSAGASRASRAIASSWRTVPTRHGTHWPQDASRKNAAIRRSAAGRSAMVSKASTTPEPSVAPIARVPSSVSGTSSWSGSTNPRPRWFAKALVIAVAG